LTDSAADSQTGRTPICSMAQTHNVYDDALIKWHSENRLVEGEADTGRAAADQQFEMVVEDDGKLDAVSSDQAYMFISDASELQSLGVRIFGNEPTDGVTVSVKQPQNSGLLPVLSETDIQRFDGTVEPGDLGRGEQEGSPSNTADPSPSTSVNNSVQPDNPHPLGSSQNPIRIIQQGNKYTSMQELSPEQLNQIMQVGPSPTSFHIEFIY